MNPILEYVGYVAVAILAVLGNKFLGVPDVQTTALIVGGVMTALGIVKVGKVAVNGNVSQVASALQANTEATKQNTLAHIDSATFTTGASSSNVPSSSSVSSKGPL